MIRLPAYLDEITSFYAVEVFQAAKALEAQGRSIVHLEFGEPDFPTPAVVTEAAIEALRRGATRYTHSLGIPELRQTICEYHNAKYGLALEPEQVLVSAGSSVLMALVMLMLLEPGDEVLLADPTYACYANFVRLAHGVPVSVPIRESEGFQLDPAAVKAKITPRTRALLICSPANPTGVVMRPEVLQELAGLGVPIVSDEIYHGLAYGGRERSILEFTDNALVLNGYSKFFAMTGWRLGYLLFPRELMPTVMRLHQNVMISAPDFPQYAAIAAMREAVPTCEGYVKEYDRRRLYVIERLGKIGLPLHYEPAGAFYVFADARHIEPNSLKLSMEILNETGVAVTPGFDFGPGGEGYLRFSYANSLENITEALDRLEGFLARRSRG
ncbi:MAG TPA: pyridoxal phosphate-dependent aminotransferase [bacterium]|nr:pyridoxal phosphate-dependent aminotransferase [bacterium]